MSRYIDKDKALNLQYWAGEGRIRYGVVDADDIENMPEEDVAPVRHGKWIFEEGWAVCSCCRISRPQRGTTEVGFIISYPYCPNCGAKMDLE